MTTSLVAFISSQSNPVCLLSLHWEKTTTIETIFLFWKKKYLCVFMSCSKWDVLCMFCAHHPCIRYQHTIIICTLLHRAHGVCTYTVILCHVWLLLFFFFIHVHVSDFFCASKQWNNWHVSSNWLDVCFSECACMCARALCHVIFFSLLFIVRENKSPWRKWIECVLPRRCCELAVNVRCTVLIRSYYLVLVVRVWSLFTSGSNVRPRWGPRET